MSERRTALDGIERALGAVETGASVLAALVVFALAFLTAADVVLRYGFNRPIPGSWELSQLMLAGIVFLGLAHSQSAGRHVRVELLVGRLPPRGQRALALVAVIAGLVIFGLICWAGTRDSWNAWATADYTLGSIAFPVWPSKLMVPLGSALLCARLLAQAARHLVSVRRVLPDR